MTYKVPFFVTLGGLAVMLALCIYQGEVIRAQYHAIAELMEMLMAKFHLRAVPI